MWQPFRTGPVLLRYPISCRRLGDLAIPDLFGQLGVSLFHRLVVVNALTVGAKILGRVFGGPTRFSSVNSLTKLGRCTASARRLSFGCVPSIRSLSVLRYDHRLLAGVEHAALTIFA